MKHPLVWAAAALILASGLLAAYISQKTPASAVPLPDFVHNASHKVVQAYEYAVTHPEELAKYPCYCGCGAMGHTSNLSCYIQSFNTDGTVTWDNHAIGCGICVDIALDVERLKGEGWSSPDVRTYIDNVYGRFGPGTNTPLPTT